MSTPSGTSQEAIPVLYHHCVSVYEEMFKYATKQRVEGVDMIVYEGHLTRLFKDLRMSVPYYSMVTRELKRMGCIKQLRRGGGNAESQWELIRQPTQELYLEVTTRVKSAKDERLDMLEQQVRSLIVQQGKLQQQVNALAMHVDGWRAG